MKTILILGAGTMQAPALRAARELGLWVCAVDGNPHAPCAALADEFTPIDLADSAALVAHARAIRARRGLDAVFTAATDFSVSVAAVAEACALPGHRLEATKNATDKTRMRACFTRARLRCPRSTFLEPDSFAWDTPPGHARLCSHLHSAGLSFPLVVKPTDNMGARGCTLAQCKDTLINACAVARQFSRSGRVIIEEFIVGREFSLEGLIFDGTLYVTALADRHICFPPSFVEMGHTLPAALCTQDAQALIDTFHNGVRALGLTHGAVKGDLFLSTPSPTKTPSTAATPNPSAPYTPEAVLGEIAARLSGGFMSGWTVPYALGFDVTRAALHVALHGPSAAASAATASVAPPPTALTVLRTQLTTLSPLPEKSPYASAERAWISIPGVIHRIWGLADAQQIAYVKNVFVRMQEGAAVRFPRNNVEKCGNVLSQAPTRAQAIAAAETACRCIVLRLVPAHPATDAFLARKRSAESAASPALQDADSEYAASAPHPFGQESIPDIVCDASGRFFTSEVACAPLVRTGLFLIPEPLVRADARDVQGRSIHALCTLALKVEPAL